MKDKTLFELAAIASLIGSAYAFYKWTQVNKINAAAAFASPQGVGTPDNIGGYGGNLMTQLAGMTILPNNVPTDAGFSNYARIPAYRFGMALQSQPNTYGQVIPQ